MKALALSKGSPDPLAELAAYLEPFASLFRRHASHHSLKHYVAGLLNDLPRLTARHDAQVVTGTQQEVWQTVE